MAGLRHAIDERPDLVVLDLGLPDLDGARCCACCAPSARCRSSWRQPATTTGQSSSRSDAGADDYVVKPFSADQLDARIRAVLRRTSTHRRRGHQFTVGDLDVDVRSRTAVLAGKELDLRPREFDLLAYLVARPGEVVSKRDLLAEVWQSPYGGADKTVDVHLSWLRRKLGETAAEPRLLHSVRGVGVKLVEPGRWRRLALLGGRTTSVVLLAFLLPAASLVARVAEARALDAAQVQMQVLIPPVGLDQRADVAAAVAAAGSGGRTVAVRWTDGQWLGCRVRSGVMPRRRPRPSSPGPTPPAWCSRSAGPTAQR